jgi:hypothetical protein
VPTTEPETVTAAPASPVRTGPTAIMLASVVALALGLTLLAASTVRTRAARR